MAAVLKKARRKLSPAPFETKANREAEHGLRAALHRAFVRLRAKVAEQVRHETWRKQAVRKGYDPNHERDEHDHAHKAFDPDQPRDESGRWGDGSTTSVEHSHDGYKITLSAGGEKIGEAHLRWNEKEGVAELETLGIRGSDQGKGAGSKLLDESIAFAADRWPGKTLLVGTTEPKLKGALERRGATPHPESDSLMVLQLPARKIGKAIGDPDDPEWLLAGEIAERLDLGELAFVVDEVGSALDVVASAAGEATLAAIGVDEQQIVDQIDLGAADWARDRSAELVGMRYDEQGNLVEAERASMRIDESTRMMIQETIYQGLVEGKRSSEIADDLESGSRETEYPFSEERAALIANTEIRRAHNEGSLTGMRGALDAGVEVKKSWITSGHETVCEDCDDNEAAGPIDVDDEFPSGDDSAPAHPNCNCDIVAEVPETPADQED